MDKRARMRARGRTTHKVHPRKAKEGKEKRAKALRRIQAKTNLRMGTRRGRGKKRPKEKAKTPTG